MPSSSWPILTHYADERLREIAFPVGGIGTGTISLGGRAELRDFEIMNHHAKGTNPLFTFFVLRAQRAGEPAVTRVLEGVLQPPYSGPFGVRLPLAGLPRLRHVELDTCYPFARYTLGDPDLPLTVYLEAFNPLIPLDAERSGLPVAVLRYVLANSSSEPVQASVAGSLYNFIGSRTVPCSGHRILWPWTMANLLGGNVNEVRRATANAEVPLVGILMRSERVPSRSPEDGTMALVALTTEATWRRTWGTSGWNRHILTFWDDFGEDGRLDDPNTAPPSPEGEGQVGSLAVAAEVPAHGSVAVTFLLTWHFPHRTAEGCGWETTDPNGGWIGNHYATHYTDAWDVALQVAAQIPQLEADSLRFARAFVESTLPQAVKEAALNNLSTLRTQNCFRTADGRFFGFEGGYDDQIGLGYGSCTHVWNYEQATAFLFPELARSMRDTELEQGTLENGLNCFRLSLPPEVESYKEAAADGQMGVVMKCYREWQLTGDSEWLAQHWTAIRSLVSYAWLPGRWDADQDGVMEGIQHNTYDVEFYGPNPLTGVWYLGALRAAEEMARAVGDVEFALKCHSLFRQGSAWVDNHLFNGEYYVQQIRTPPAPESALPELCARLEGTDLANPDYQLGNCCLLDQLVGQYMAHIVGLGYLLDPDHVRTALGSLLRYNWRQNLYGHWNNMRTFALNDEAALLIASWPHSDRPKAPFPYFNEVMTGFEYQAAVHMIYEGLIHEGVEIIAGIRRRFDGHRRNPWNEPEGGHHYVRAMASWAAVLALCSFRYSAVTRTLAVSPCWHSEAFSCPWSVPSGWGTIRQTITAGAQTMRCDVFEGELALREVRTALPNGCHLGNAQVLLGACEVPARARQDSSLAIVTLDRDVQVTPASPLVMDVKLSAP